MKLLPILHHGHGIYFLIDRSHTATSPCRPPPIPHSRSVKEKHYTIVSGSSMRSSNLSSSAEAEQQDGATHFVSPMFNSLHSRFNNQHRPQFPPEIVINLDSGGNYQEESSSSGGGNAPIFPIPSMATDQRMTITSILN